MGDLIPFPLPRLEVDPAVNPSLRRRVLAGVDCWPELQAWEPGWWRSAVSAPLRARLNLMLKR